jgi:hypothetical protein
MLLPGFHARVVLTLLRRLTGQRDAADSGSLTPISADAWPDRAALWQEARRLSTVGLGTYLAVAGFWGGLHLVAEFTDRTEPLPDISITVDTDDGAAILAAFAGLIVAITLASRSAAPSGSHRPVLLLRGQVLEQLGRLSSAVSVLVGSAVLAGSFTGQPDLLARGSLAALSGVLAVLAVSGTSSSDEDRQLLAQFDQELRAREAERYDAAASNWSPATPITKKWLVREAVRWVLTVTCAFIGLAFWNSAAWLKAIGGSLVLGGVFIIIGAAGGCLVFSFIRDLVDRNLLLASTSALLLVIWEVAGLVLTLELWTSESGGTTGRLTLTIYVLGVFSAFPLLTAVGCSRRAPRWTWFRPGLALRGSLHAHCERRLQELRGDTRQNSDDRPQHRWPRERLRQVYAEISGQQLREPDSARREAVRTD